MAKQRFTDAQLAGLGYGMLTFAIVLYYASGLHRKKIK